MSHELRTPLNAILGFTEMMIDGLYGEVPAELKEPLADIQANGKHLLRLINDVLDLSKIEAGRMELALSEYSVRRRGRRRCGPRCARSPSEKGLEFRPRSTDDLPERLRRQRSAITQCLINLAGNALEVHASGAGSTSASSARATVLRYRVADTGIGIAPRTLDDVFAEFRQVDATITREFGGTGLGLSITKKFVEMHGGRIWVESQLGRARPSTSPSRCRAESEATV